MSDLLPEFQDDYNDPRGDIMWRSAVARCNYICKTMLAKDREIIQQLAEALRLAISLWPHDDSREGKIAAESLYKALALAEPYLQKGASDGD